MNTKLGGAAASSTDGGALDVFSIAGKLFEIWNAASATTALKTTASIKVTVFPHASKK